MTEAALRAALRATALAVDARPEAWEENRRRIRASGRRRRSTLGAGVLAAAASVAAVVVAGGLLPSGPSPVPDRLDQVDAPAPDEPPVTVGLSVSGAGPLEVTVGEVTPSENAWRQHAFVVRNTSDQTVHVNHFRFSRFLGDRQLLAGLGCGYGIVQGAAAEACFLYYQPLTLEPGESDEVPMLLYRDLPGMNPLDSGRYPLQANLAYRMGAPFASVEDGAQASVAAVSLAYTIREPVTGTDVRAGGPFSEPGVIPPGCVPGGVPQDNVRCELPGQVRVDVAEAELLGPVADHATVRPRSDTGISYGPYVAVTIRSEEEQLVPGLAYGAVSAPAQDGDGAIGLSGICGKGWRASGERVTEDPCPAATPATGIGFSSPDAFAFTLHPRVGDREVQPGRYELLLPLDTGHAEDALWLVLVVSSVAPA